LGKDSQNFAMIIYHPPTEKVLMERILFIAFLGMALGY
jgi:hypothetical protein